MNYIPTSFKIAAGVGARQIQALADNQAVIARYFTEDIRARLILPNLA